MPIDIPLTITYIIVIAATWISGGYFALEYNRKKVRASLAWAVGFVLYGITVLTDLVVIVGGEIVVGAPGLVVALLVTALGMTMFYYGASLLFFNPKSFFRERMSLLFMLLFSAYSIYLVATLPIVGFREAVRPPIQLGLMLSIFLIITVLFYRVSARLSSDDPRKRIVLFVAIGWSFMALNALGRGLLLGIHPLLDATINIIQLPAWALILWGMTLGKAGRT